GATKEINNSIIENIGKKRFAMLFLLFFHSYLKATLRTNTIPDANKTTVNNKIGALSLVGGFSSAAVCPVLSSSSLFLSSLPLSTGSSPCFSSFTFPELPCDGTFEVSKLNVTV